MNTLDARRRLLGRNVYKKTTEGNPAIAQGSLARRDPGIEMQGWTEQAQYEGKNLFDGIFTVDTVLNKNGETVPYSGRSTTDFIKVKQSTDYTGFVRYLRACYYDAGKVIISYDEDDTVTRQTPEGCEYVRFSFINGSDVMFNEGSVALPYEPYTGGAPSPSPDYPQEIVSARKYDEASGKYKYEVQMTGANLIDYTQATARNESQSVEIIDGGVKWTGDYYFIILVTGLKKNQAYTLSYLSDDADSWAFGYTDGTYSRQYLNGSASTTDPEKDCDKVFIYKSNPSVAGQDMVFTDIMLNEGSTALPYEPYRLPQAVTLTSDRPLTKWDRLEKRGGQWGWVYKSAEIVLDGSEDWEIYPYYGNSFIINDPTFENRYESSFCDKYRNVNAVWAKEGIYNAYSDHPNNAIKYFKPPSAEVQTVGRWKTWLSENPLTLWYETAEETFTPLSETEQEQMNELYTFRPTTVLSNDAGCDMSLTYKTKKSMGGG